jgi:hypothetical protein
MNNNISRESIINDRDSRFLFFETYKLNLVIGEMPDPLELDEDDQISLALMLFEELKEDLTHAEHLKKYNQIN